eukprot:11916122-Karenia_brevis.AAC.1
MGGSTCDPQNAPRGMESQNGTNNVKILLRPILVGNDGFQSGDEGIENDHVQLPNCNLQPQHT